MGNRLRTKEKVEKIDNYGMPKAMKTFLKNE
jgi:hypothetical protein